MSLALRVRARALACTVAVAFVAATSLARADEVTPPPPPPDASTNEKVPPTAPASAPQPPSAETIPKQPNVGGEFSFGSYGRVVTASDLRGGSGVQSNIVTHGTRIDESTYAELQLERRDVYPTGAWSKVVSTLGIAGPLFHETGDFDAKIAVRNLYAEAGGMFHDGLTAWVGSRMYRGDDIYLLDWWPLDNLNTVGGGLRLALDTTSKQATSFAIHTGMNRPLDPFYFQERPSSSPTGFGSTDVITLDRPRVIVSEKATHIERIGTDGMGAKFVLYSEQHSISKGTFTTDAGDKQPLPADSGLVYGAQLGFFTGHRDTFVNLFVRYATGIAAYGDNTVPTALSPDKSTMGAHEFLTAISANYEVGPFGVLVGGYVRAFKDASGNPYSRNTYNEGTLTVRPQVWFLKYLGLALEGSYQQLAAAGVDDNGNPIRAKEWRFGVIPFITPAGEGSFTRPHLRVIYAFTHRDDGARALYAPDDKFYKRNVEHFLGLGVEWWFNSSYR